VHEGLPAVALQRLEAARVRGPAAPASHLRVHRAVAATLPSRAREPDLAKDARTRTHTHAHTRTRAHAKRGGGDTHARRQDARQAKRGGRLMYT
jgi:hypothetical protein